MLRNCQIVRSVWSRLTFGSDLKSLLKSRSQPELRLDDLCKAETINRIVADFDKRPTVRQCEPNPNVSRFLIN